MDAKEITERAKKENIPAIVYGPLAFDNAVSKNAAKIKEIHSDVAGSADIILVPNLETGNALVKMMIYFMGACAAGVVLGGKVPIVVTSRADDKISRLASIAAAIISTKNKEDRCATGVFPDRTAIGHQNGCEVRRFTLIKNIFHSFIMIHNLGNLW